MPTGVADIYPLSPAQEGLLFHAVYAPESSLCYIAQMSWRWRNLDPAALQQAIDAVIARHASFRTAFVWDGPDRPLQVIGQTARLTLSIHDWTRIADAEHRLAAFLADYRRVPIDLRKAPLMRVALIQLDRDAWIVVWTCHHLIMDASSAHTVFAELLSFYTAARDRAAPPALSPAPQYRDYIAWLSRQDHAAAAAFWATALDGYRPERVRLPRVRVAGKSDHEMDEACVVLSPENAARLERFARAQRLTKSTLAQAAWALVLASWLKTDDVVFGMTVSARPASLPDAASIVGVLLNVLPLRIAVAPEARVVEWLRHVHATQVAMRAYDFCRLVQVRRWAGIGGQGSLFDSILTFQNYARTRLDGAGALEISDVRLVTSTSYPLTLLIDPGTRWRIRLVFDPDFVTRDRAGALVQQVADTLSACCTSTTEARLHEICSMTDRRFAPTTVTLPAEVTDDGFVARDALDQAPDLPVLRPAVEDVDLAGWMASKPASVMDLVRTHGALLLRGFDVRSIAQFEECAQSLCPSLYADYGDLPRSSEGGKVYASTPYPAEHMIPFHNESSHLDRWPLRLWFYCVTAARQGGETPIVDGRRVFARLDPRIRARFEEKGLMYVRNFVEGFDVSWQDFFHTTDRAIVEAQSRQAAVEVEWRADGVLRTRQVRRAVARHPETGEPAFFNQIQLHHHACLPSDVREQLESLYAPEDMPRSVFYGDGTPIDDAIVREICDLYQEVCWTFRWRNGDILMVDNMLVAHARNPFDGPRRIAVAMGDMFHQEQPFA